MRQSGRSTAQMRAAPRDAIFICTRENLVYMKDLAKFIGRDDLRVCSVDVLESQRLRGQTVTGIVVDHWALIGLTHQQAQERRMLSDRIAVIRPMWPGARAGGPQ